MVEVEDMVIKKNRIIPKGVYIVWAEGIPIYYYKTR